VSFDRALQAATRAYLRLRRYAFVSVPLRLAADGKTVLRPKKGQSLVRYASCLRGPGKIDRRDVREMLRAFPST